MSDPVLARTLLALLRTYPASNPFWLGRLAARPEGEVMQALGALEVQGQVSQVDARWSLTSAGEAATQPAHGTRPISPAKYRAVAKRKPPTSPYV